MPMYESQPVKVTLTIEVDGHVLTFTETPAAKGARYHGADPRDTGYSTSETLESSIRLAVTAGSHDLRKRAIETVARLYPVTEANGA